tara:strand:- start:60062 stop:61387 length:1326 start_codon:yes stop_codon:yes gene_type:complete
MNIHLAKSQAVGVRLLILMFVAALFLGGCSSSGRRLQVRPQQVSLHASDAEASDQGLVEIPVEFHGHEVIAEVMINGTGPHRMILDTGSAVCQISPEVARQAGIRRSSSVRTRDAHGGSHREGMGIAETIRVGALDGQGVPLTIDDLPPFIAADGDIVGILGYNMFTGHTLVIDYPEQRVFLSDWRLASSTPGTVPLKLINGRVPSVRVDMMTGHERRGMPLEMIVDTGSGAGVALAGYYTALYADTKHTYQRGASMSASGSIQPVHYARMNYDMDLQGVVIRKLMAIVNEDLREDHTTIGGDFMRKFRVSIDPVGRHARFELPGGAPDGAKEIVMPVWKGHGFRQSRIDDGRGLVESVVEGSAAQRGGLQPGDIIVGFDGQPLSIDPLHWPLPIQDESIQIRLFEIERDGQRLELMLEFQDILPDPEFYKRHQSPQPVAD